MRRGNKSYEFTNDSDSLGFLVIKLPSTFLRNRMKKRQKKILEHLTNGGSG